MGWLAEWRERHRIYGKLVNAHLDHGYGVSEDMSAEYMGQAREVVSGVAHRCACGHGWKWHDRHRYGTQCDAYACTCPGWQPFGRTT